MGLLEAPLEGTALDCGNRCCRMQTNNGQCMLAHASVRHGPTKLRLGIAHCRHCRTTNRDIRQKGPSLDKGQELIVAPQGTTEAMSYNAIFSPLIRRSELYCSPVLLLGSIASGPRSMLHYVLGLKPKHGCALRSNDNEH